MGSLVAILVAFLIFAILIVAAITHIHRFLQEDSLTTEEWAIMMLTDYRNDVENAIADIQTRQQQGADEVFVHKFENKPPEVSITMASQYTTESLIGNELYQRLMKKCVCIGLHENGVISFHRKGFFTGYTGFYYSPTGTEAAIGGDADWYETDWLEGNYFCFEFGY